MTVRQPAGFFVPCVGGKLRLSPFYAEQTLTDEIKELKVSAAPPPFSATTAAEPPACTTATLGARITSTASGNGGTIVQLRLSNGGSTCVLPRAGRRCRSMRRAVPSLVAKILPDAATLQAERSLLTTYKRGTAQSTVLTLQHGGSVSIALLAAGTPTRACHRLTSVTVYPAAVALGAGRAVQDRRAGEHLRVTADPLVSPEPSRRHDDGDRTRGTRRGACGYGRDGQWQLRRLLLRYRQLRPGWVRPGPLHRTSRYLRQRHPRLLRGVHRGNGLLHELERLHY